MKTICGICVALGILAYLLGGGAGCAHGPNPCIGPASARPTMPCTCPGTTDPACYPFPSDATRTDGGTTK